MITEMGHLMEWKVGKVIAIGQTYGFRTTLTFEKGKRVRQKSGFLKRKEAEQQRDQVAAGFYSNIYILDESIRAEQFFRFWLEEVKRPLLTNDSYNAYRNCVNNYMIPLLGRFHMTQLEKEHIEALYKKAAERSRSVAKILKTVVTSSMAYAVAEHYLPFDPSAAVLLPKLSQKKRLLPEAPVVLTADQVTQLLYAGMDTSIFLPMLFAVLMGLRRGEICGLKYSDVDFTNRTIHIQRQLGKIPCGKGEESGSKTKTKQEIPLKTPSGNRVLDIPVFVFEEIMEERIRYEKRRSRRKKEFQDLDYICCSSYGRPRGRTYFWSPFKRLLREHGLPDIKWHGLRHTYTTILLKAGCGLLAISHSLGHKKAFFSANVYGDDAILREGLYPKWIDAFADEQEKANDFSRFGLSESTFI
ncbi:MAG: tyrosine-type recombinase/integrase [Eubacteriales bacterium]|nr:tyrosine-type recombinase/integrase [Eubacteriales bacterium]